MKTVVIRPFTTIGISSITNPRYKTTSEKNSKNQHFVCPSLSDHPVCRVEALLDHAHIGVVHTCEYDEGGTLHSGFKCDVSKGKCVECLLDTDCDAKDVEPTCEHPGIDYSCSGGECQDTVIPQLTGDDCDDDDGDGNDDDGNIVALTSFTTYSL